MYFNPFANISLSAVLKVTSVQFTTLFPTLSTSFLFFFQFLFYVLYNISANSKYEHILNNSIRLFYKSLLYLIITP